MALLVSGLDASLRCFHCCSRKSRTPRKSIFETAKACREHNTSRHTILGTAATLNGCLPDLKVCTGQYPRSPTASSSLWQCPSIIDRLLQFTRSWSIVRIPLIALEIELIATRGVLYPLIILNSLYPSLPAAANLRVRPSTIRLQDPAQAQHPGSKRDVDKGDL